MGGGAWLFLAGGVICMVNSVNERDLNLLNSYTWGTTFGADCQTLRLPPRRCLRWKKHIAESRPLLGALPLPVSVKNHSSAKKSAHRNTSFQSTKSRTGGQFLLLHCRARACANGVFFQTPLSLASRGPPPPPRPRPQPSGRRLGRRSAPAPGWKRVYIC